MDSKKLFSKLTQADKLHVLNWMGKSVYVHEDHRFATLLPFLLSSHPESYKLVMFDGHHDCAELSENTRKIVGEFNGTTPLEKIFTFVKDNLASNDGDWVKGSMELGLINNAVIFGVRHEGGMSDMTMYTDLQGLSHRIIQKYSMPGDMLGFQGALSDLATDYRHKELWHLLGWKHIPKSQFVFVDDGARLWINIDLDAFEFICDDFYIPWNDEIFEKKFDEISDYSTTNGWSGRKFISELLDRADLISIAREPTYCGGEKKCNQIFDLVNKYMFDGKLINHATKL